MTKQLMVLVAAVVLLLINSIFIEPNVLDVVKYEIEDSYLQGAKVVYVSDFHLKRGDYNRLDRIVKKINEQDPNIVLLGGDFATGKSLDKTMNPEIMAQKLSLLDAPTYAVLGENDWKVGGNKITDALLSVGIRVLDNSNVRIILNRRYLDIIGLADYSSRTVKIGQAMRRTVLPRIVFTHSPDVYYDIADDVTIILAGHTHGGQFAIPFVGPFFVQSKYGTELASGLIRKTNNKMIVSKGLGTTAVPIRFNCKPEITLVQFVQPNMYGDYEEPKQPRQKKKIKF